MNNVTIIGILLGKDVKNRTIEDSRKDILAENEKLEEVLFKNTGENDLKHLKTEFPDKSRYLVEKNNHVLKNILVATLNIKNL